MYLYRFCPSWVHPQGRGRVGASLAASAAPAVKISASSQTELSYSLRWALLHAAVCSQREPSPSWTGTGRPFGAGSRLGLHASASPSLPMLLGRVSCSLLGYLCTVQEGSTGNLRQQLLCMDLATLQSLPRVSTGPPFSPGASTTSLNRPFKSVAWAAHESGLDDGQSVS